MTSRERLGEIRGQLWRFLDVRDSYSGIEIQRLQEEANSIVHGLSGTSPEALGTCTTCGANLTHSNTARDEVGILRIDTENRLWCNNCVEEQ